MLKKLELENPSQIIAWTYKDLTWQRFASLASIVLEGVKEGDQVANEILDRAVHGLEETILAVANKLQFENGKKFPLVLAGGNFTHTDSVLANRLIARLKQVLPDAEPVIPQEEPVMGAAFLAIEGLKM